MKYVIRAVKYFLYITVIFGVILWILACITSHKLIYDIQSVADTLVHGWGSVGLILGVFAAVSAIYPLMGYTKMPVAVGGSLAELRDVIGAYMTDRGYVFEKQSIDSLCYRMTSGTGKLARTWEDRITITQNAGGLIIEGLRKDVVRIAAGLETRLGAKNE